DRDLARQVTARDRRGDVGDVSNLIGQVRRHEVHVVGQVLPGAGDARHLRLTTQLPIGAHLARDAGDLGREAVQLIDHRVDGRPDAQELALYGLAFDVEHHLLRQVAGRDGLDDTRDFTGRGDEIGDERI